VSFFFEGDSQCYGFNYAPDSPPVSLSMPYKASTYLWKSRLHPIFDMNMPEGYLFEVLKSYLNKQHGYINDFLLFSYLCPSIHGRLLFDSDLSAGNFDVLDLDDVLKNDSEDIFVKLVKMFLGKMLFLACSLKHWRCYRTKNRSLRKNILLKHGELNILI